MRFVPTVPVGFQDPKLIKIFTDIVRNLVGVLDLNTYKLDLVWNPPVTLQIPTFGGMPRKSSPDVVRVCRAIDPANPLSPVHFGATAWTWNGDGSVNVTDVDGLVQGVKYSLVFEAVG